VDEGDVSGTTVYTTAMVVVSQDVTYRTFDAAGYSGLFMPDPQAKHLHRFAGENEIHIDLEGRPPCQPIQSGEKKRNRM
jgi:hypothetical protein